MVANEAFKIDVNAKKNPLNDRLACGVSNAILKVV